MNSPNVIHLVRKIISNYILNGSEGNPNYQKGPPNIVRLIPNIVPENELIRLYSTNGNNALGLSGDAIDRILSGFGTMKAVNKEASGMVAHTAVFDDLDCIVFFILKQKHMVRANMCCLLCMC